MVNVATRALLRPDPVAPSDVLDLRRGAREKRPARRVRPVYPGILLEDLRRVALGIHSNSREEHLRAEVGPELRLEAGQLRGEEGTRIGAARVDESDGDDLAPEVSE